MNNINNDLISRQQAIDAVKKNTFRLKFVEEQNYESSVAWSTKAVYSDLMEEALLDLPSAQPEIIRCKDCKHSRFFDPCFYCYEMGGEIIVPENGFCFKAKRREDG